MAASGDANGVTVLEPGGPNAIAVTNGIVGDEWTLWIVQLALNSNFTQYNSWLRAGPISSAVLTTRLARLVDADIMERVAYQDRPPRSEYRLTRRGREMWPILVTMWAWEQRWANLPEEHLPFMRHSACGEYFAPVQICDACDEPTTVRDVRAKFGPSGSWERSIPSAATRRRSRSGTGPTEPVTQAMALLGNRWSVALLGACFFGASRFGEFEQRIGAPPTIVADRLKTFCRLGVLEQAPSEHRPSWVTYHLTEKGRAFYPVVAATIDWGQRWFQAPEGAALKPVHLGCGRAFRPRLRCDQCGQRVRGATVQVVRGAAEAAEEVAEADA